MSLTSGRISSSLKGSCKTLSGQYLLSGMRSQGFCFSLSKPPPDPCSPLSFSPCNQHHLIRTLWPPATMHTAWLSPLPLSLAGSSLKGFSRRREGVSARGVESPFPHAERKLGEREVSKSPAFPFRTLASRHC